MYPAMQSPDAEIALEGKAAAGESYKVEGEGKNGVGGGGGARVGSAFQVTRSYSLYYTPILVLV